MSTLVTYYSNTGHTSTLAHEIATRLGAEEEPIVERDDRKGTWGTVTGAIGAVLGLASRIAPANHDPGDFDLVVIGTPIWSAGAAPAVNRYIDMHRKALGKVAFFCTEGGSGDALAFSRMERRIGKPPVARLALKEDALKKGKAGDKIERFVAELREAG